MTLKFPILIIKVKNKSCNLAILCIYTCSDYCFVILRTDEANIILRMKTEGLSELYFFYTYLSGLVKVPKIPYCENFNY